MQADSYIRELRHRMEALLRYDAEHQLPLVEMRLLEAVLDGYRDDDLANVLHLSRRQLRGIEQEFRVRQGHSVYEVALMIERSGARISSYPKAV